jgi:hypothetical protein
VASRTASLRMRRDALRVPRGLPSVDHAAASGFDHAPAEPETCRRPRTCRLHNRTRRLLLSTASVRMRRDALRVPRDAVRNRIRRPRLSTASMRMRRDAVRVRWGAVRVRRESLLKRIRRPRSCIASLPIPRDILRLRRLKSPTRRPLPRSRSDPPWSRSGPGIDTWPLPPARWTAKACRVMPCSLHVS